MIGQDSTNDADKIILTQLAPKSYSDIERDIAELASLDDAPIWSEDKYRGVVSILECFFTVSDLITGDDLNKFFDIALLVLSEDDPALDLDVNERWAANLHNKVRDNSKTIRDGLSQNLILLAVHGNGLMGHRLGIDVEAKVSFLVKSLLKNKDERVWQAQQNELPKYAEAAPDIFLSIIEDELSKDKPAFDILFKSVDSSIFSRCERTGMLWALELLAWNPDRLSRVVKVLCKLSLYKLNDNWANKPINSLGDILLAWKPHTAASVDKRCEVLELICKEYPSSGWNLCISTIGPNPPMTSGTYRPRWRADASGAGNILTRGEIRIFALKCLEIMLAWPLHTLETLKDLVTCMSSMREEDSPKVLKIIQEWISKDPDDDDIIALREHVRTRTMTSRALIKQQKNDSKDRSVAGKELYELLTPADMILKHHWLFASVWVDYTPEELETDLTDHEARDKGLEKQRTEALNEIHSKLGSEGIIKLLSKSQAGYHIGLLYSKLIHNNDIPDFIIQCISHPTDNLIEFNNCISGIISTIQDAKLPALASQLMARLGTLENSNVNITRLLTCFPFTKTTWDLLHSQQEEVRQSYWRDIKPQWCDDSNDLNYAIKKLIDKDRPFTAFFLCHYKFKMVESDIIIKLLNCIASNSNDTDHYYKPTKHDIERALLTLNSRDNFDKQELIKLEYIFVEILHSHSEYGIPNISREISKTPLLFIQLLAYCFKRDDGTDDSDIWNIPTNGELKTKSATRAYYILDTINFIPGTRDNGDIDLDDLKGWVAQVRNLAKEHGRIGICDQQLGKLFSTSAIGDDGIWPRPELREIVDEIGTPDLLTGMELGLYNSGGVEFVDIDNKMKTAATYKDMGTKIINKYPAVGKMLLNLSGMYLQNAKHWESEKRIRKRLNDF